MQEKYELLFNVLNRFHKANILKDMILVGSWCIYFYKNHLFPEHNITPIRTKDIDFLLPFPNKLKHNSMVDLEEILKEDGFILNYDSTGVMRLGHADMSIEFIVPLKGKGTDKIVNIPSLKINAQALRYLNFLKDNILTILINAIPLQIPQPAVFALHKLIVSEERESEADALQDRQQALDILNALISQVKSNEFITLFNVMFKSWQSKVLSALKHQEEENIIAILKKCKKKSQQNSSASG